MQTTQQEQPVADVITVTDARGGQRHKRPYCLFCNREFGKWSEYNTHMRVSGCRWWREMCGRVRP